MEEQVDESYDPTADFFRAAPQATPMHQPEYAPVDVVSVPIPEGAIPQGEVIDIEMPQVEAASATAANNEVGSAGSEGTSGAPGMSYCCTMQNIDRFGSCRSWISILYRVAKVVRDTIAQKLRC